MSKNKIVKKNTGKRIFKLKKRYEGLIDYNKYYKILKGNKSFYKIKVTNRSLVIFDNHLINYGSTKVSRTRHQLIGNVVLKKLGKLSLSKGTAYLTGKYFAEKILSENVKAEQHVLYFGVLSPKHDSRQYAAIKGMVDGGANIKIEADKLLYQPDERINQLYDKLLAATSKSSEVNNAK